MRSISVFLAGAAAIAVVAGAGSVSAATIFTPLNQAALNTFGTSNFGAIITNTGAFNHTFSFTTSAKNTASGSVVTISLPSGAKDIDFSSVFLDTFAFTQIGFDPNAETWQLTTATLAAGAHAIFVNGNVVTSGPGRAAASYAGTLNLTPVPEPATWTMMILGFGAAGSLVRRRRGSVA